ncbi:uncharacterized protein LOC120189884 [Hibiscus syriacus]|uniref:uncharacterized protein LOC120189884 n=1 Tax=Hibiscus syriacus TaxID=106335 RepID=UPI001921AF6A|nr:uncharacterized protein LOC120189884 [Hibiscus syriacus]
MVSVLDDISPILETVTFVEELLRTSITFFATSFWLELLGRGLFEQIGLLSFFSMPYREWIEINLHSPDRLAEFVFSMPYREWIEINLRSPGWSFGFRRPKGVFQGLLSSPTIVNHRGSCRENRHYHIGSFRHSAENCGALKQGTKLVFHCMQSQSMAWHSDGMTKLKPKHTAALPLHLLSSTHGAASFPSTHSRPPSPIATDESLNPKPPSAHRPPLRSRNNYYSRLKIDAPCFDDRLITRTQRLQSTAPKLRRGSPPPLAPFHSAKTGSERVWAPMVLSMCYRVWAPMVLSMCYRVWAPMVLSMVLSSVGDSLEGLPVGCSRGMDLLDAVGS